MPSSRGRRHGGTAAPPSTERPNDATAAHQYIDRQYQAPTMETRQRQPGQHFPQPAHVGPAEQVPCLVCGEVPRFCRYRSALLWRTDRVYASPAARTHPARDGGAGRWPFGSGGRPGPDCEGFGAPAGEPTFTRGFLNSLEDPDLPGPVRFSRLLPGPAKGGSQGAGEPEPVPEHQSRTGLFTPPLGSFSAVRRITVPSMRGPALAHVR